MTTMMTIADVKSYLNISQAAAYNLVKRKDFPVCRIGSSIRVPADAFERWVKLHTSTPRALAGTTFCKASVPSDVSTTSC